jgi:HD-GYP domain-containing protein (c-di-GMP phosphodiesterase class II)
MSDPTRFLSSLAQTLATMSLYAEGHPARIRAADTSLDQLRALQRDDPTPSFSFLGTNVIYNQRSLRSLRDWEWAERLGNAGVQRMEFDAAIDRDAYHAFLDDVLARVSASAGRAVAMPERPSRPVPIRYGAIGVRGMNDGAGEIQALAQALSGLQHFDLSEEAEAVEWIHDEVRTREEIPLIEAEAVVSSLTLAMHADSRIMLPLLSLKEFDQYTTTHALNVAVLTMGLAEYLGLAAAEVRAYGVAGLLHDLGKVRVPTDILRKPGKLTDEEFAVMRRHPADGARIIIDSDRHLDLAAVVAFEHHIMIDGGGYPSRHYRRCCHQASTLVHLCDVYDALRTKRPYRNGWDPETTLSYIERGIGTEFDEDAGRAFVQMMREWESRAAQAASIDAATSDAGGESVAAAESTAS